MHKLISISIFLLLIYSNTCGQEKLNFTTVDSISYNQYLNGKWDELITTGKNAINENIDFKRLRQRIGYAYFMKGDFYKSKYNYERALEFDSSDADTRLYLYYCALNTGNMTNARYHSEFLSTDIKEKYNIKSIRILDAIDAEYNYKMNDDISRSNPSYMRIGLNTQLGYRINLYQAYSNYSQSFNSGTYYTTIQNEYFAQLNYSFLANSELCLSYHYLNAFVNSNNSYYPGNVFYGKIQTKLNRFDIGLSASEFLNTSDNSLQIGLHGGVVLPGKLNLYLKSSVYDIFNSQGNRIVYSQSVGGLLFKKLWAEGNLTLGNLNNYVDKNGLYVYNSLDETSFRTGLTLYWYVLKKITVFGNYTFDKKINYDLSNTYNQHSISGGIIWKI